MIWDSGFTSLVHDGNSRDSSVLYLMPIDGIGHEIRKFSQWQDQSKFMGFVSEID